MKHFITLIKGLVGTLFLYLIGIFLIVKGFNIGVIITVFSIIPFYLALTDTE
ncbi:hypothetical protein [Viridibacillus arvi]|uniref:hypothetical protein n=1 Tax=Viridibacillus arvi TaxID=263475 RepID=UPI0034CD1480